MAYKDPDKRREYAAAHYRANKDVYKKVASGEMDVYAVVSGVEQSGSSSPS